jgi:hypothetical protein
MNFVRHPFCVHTVGAPSDMQGTGLPVACEVDPQGTWAISFWRPTPDELMKLNAGGDIALHVRATPDQHPVVGMGVYLDSGSVRSAVCSVKVAPVLSGRKLRIKDRRSSDNGNLDEMIEVAFSEIKHATRLTDGCVQIEYVDGHIATHEFGLDGMRRLKNWLDQNGLALRGA